jgi:epoxyqueuosine reductase QueG
MTEGVKMEELTREIKRYVLDQGLDLVGVASTDGIAAITPEGYHRPSDLLPECRSSIVMALRWVDPLVDGLPELRGMYSRMMIMMNGRLDQTLLRIAHFLGQKGFLAMPVHASDPYDLSSLKGVLSHKHAAVQAGLGEFGVSNLLLTPQFGPRQRFVQLLTDAELRPDEPLNLGLCEKTVSECDYACIRACPPKVIPAPPKGPDAMKGVVRNGIKIDKPGCSYYQDRGLPHMGRNGYTYRCGMCIAACPVGSEIHKRETLARGIRPVRMIP